jgi:hypothetical protein
MRAKNILIPWFVLLTLLSPASVLAENSRDFGDYVLHYNALATDMLPPAVARDYHITRSQNRGMLNITLLKKVLGSPGQPVHARVESSATNLAGQIREIDMREIREGNAIYYLGEFGVANEETLNFKVHVRPQGERDFFEVEFSQDFYTR